MEIFTLIKGGYDTNGCFDMGIVGMFPSFSAATEAMAVAIKGVASEFVSDCSTIAEGGTNLICDFGEPNYLRTLVSVRIDSVHGLGEVNVDDGATWTSFNVERADFALPAEA